MLGAWVAAHFGRLLGQVVVCSATATTTRRVLGEHCGVPPVEAAVVSRLFLTPRGRGQGLGQRLLRAATQAATARGLTVALNVHEGAHAVPLYEQLGWHHLTTEPERHAEEEVPIRHYLAPSAERCGSALNDGVYFYGMDPTAGHMVFIRVR